MRPCTRALLLAGTLAAVVGLSLALIVPRAQGPSPQRAGSAPPAINSTFLGCGCFWHVQHEVVSQIEMGMLGRKHTSLTAFTGYAGGTRQSDDGRVCYHSFSGVGDYGRLGHAEVVSLDGVPDTLMPAVAATYFSSICVSGRRRDTQDIGSEYRSLVGLPGGLASAAGRHFAAEARKHGVRLVAGSGDDEDVAGTVYVMDSARFPFHQAEVYHQFHDDMIEAYGTNYNQLRRELAQAGVVVPTGCPHDEDRPSSRSWLVV